MSETDKVQRLKREPIIVELSEPIDAFGEQCTKLTIRPPRTGDIVECGYPLKLKQEAGDDVPTFAPVPDVCAKLLSRLADIPMGTVKSMGVGDFNDCCWIIAGFLGRPQKN